MVPSPAGAKSAEALRPDLCINLPGPLMQGAGIFLFWVFYRLFWPLSAYSHRLRIRSWHAILYTVIICGKRGWPMQISDILGVVGGLALFLYGMRMMGDGLGLLAGSSLKSILESLTRNRFKGLLVGTAIAAIIQSSNATTVMVVSFVNAGLMDLSQAIGVIMGAKIGTTMTGQLLSLRADQIAPVIAMLGVCLVMFSKKKHLHYTGQVMAGLGILFLGMSMMRTSMAPLQEVAWFRNMIVSFGNPLVGILVGAAFTAMIQSSSASVGIMQAMAAQGIVSLAQAAPVIYGMNIGARYRPF
ncbi:MAG: Na/Pi cotransporter family protein, partial [Clostridia bacterium]|nr:Na/Pi cotransporter family protein [Clostridia bacterium]